MIDSLSNAALDGSVAAVTPAAPMSAPSGPTDTGGSPASISATDPAPAARPASQPATRMRIEADGAQGYVYQLVDALTGRLLAEVPRERVQDLAGHSAYAAGALVSTCA